jgi:MoaA/NifB/PqqE/SkfB family radical SAM enzyme
MLSSIFNVEFNPNKYLVHWDKIITLMKGKDIFPVTLELEICSTCSHRCDWCGISSNTHNDLQMPVPIARKIMRETKLLGVKGIVFKGGGDSTQHPEFDKILQTAGDLEFETGVVTHGGNLDNQELLNALVRDCSYVRLAIDGPTPESRESIHGVDDFAALITGTEKLLALRGSKRHPVIGAAFCLDYARRMLAKECIRLGDNLGLDYVLIRPPFGEEVGFTPSYTPGEAVILRKEIRGAAESYTGKMPVMVGNWIGDKELETFSPEKRVREMARGLLGIPRFKYNGIEHVTKRCLASPFFVMVTADLEVYGCPCLRAVREFSFGRINYDEKISLRLILDTQQREKRLERMRKAECLAYCTQNFL